MYAAPDVRQLELKVNNKERVWCGWEHFLGGPDNECAARIPPFGRTLVAVADHKDRSHFSAGRTLLLAYACSKSPEPAPLLSSGSAESISPVMLHSSVVLRVHYSRAAVL